jgi:Fe2+ or Zn2+ uptake regulation protein
MAAEVLQFEISHHSLNFYGKCNKLANNGVCENKKIKDKKTKG